MPYVGQLGSIDAVPPLLERYGKSAARGMVDRIRRAPASARGQLMREAMAQIDKTLASRAERYALELTSHGISQAQALEQGLARAISEGMVSELSMLGTKGRTPTAGSLLGLGATASSPATSVPRGGKMVQVGPFSFPVGDKPFKLIGTQAEWNALPASWRRSITSAVTINPIEDAKLMQEIAKIAMTPNANAAQLASLANAKLAIRVVPTNKVWQDWLRIAPPRKVSMRMVAPAMTTGSWPDSQDNSLPVLRFTHPETGKPWGVFLSLTPTKENPTAAQLYVKWIPEKPWYERLFAWIASIPAEIVDAVKEVVEYVKDQTCKLLGAAAPMTAGAATTANPQAQAVAAGIQIGASLCGQTAPPPVIAPSGGGMLLPLLLIAGAGVAIYALTSE